MKEYLIRWNAGYGDSYEVVEAESEDGALTMAYDSWREEAESQASYGVEEVDEDTDLRDCDL